MSSEEARKRPCLLASFATFRGETDSCIHVLTQDETEDRKGGEVTARLRLRHTTPWKNVVENELSMFGAQRMKEDDE